MTLERAKGAEAAVATSHRSMDGQAAFLAEASRLLAATLDYEDTLARVAGMALPSLGAWCFVDLCAPNDQMRRLAVIHPDPTRQALARRLEAGWPPHRDDPFGVPRAVRTRRSEVVPHVPDEMLVRTSGGPENLEILRHLDIGSMMVVPLIARGEVLGAITYVSSRLGDPYTEADLELGEDLAARCAIAIDNARLFREAKQARDEAQLASRAKSEFLATMSHEIRTPVNAVMGYVDLLETGIGGPLAPDQVKYLERVKASNRHLLGLINDILDFARIDADRMHIQSEEVPIGRVVDAALDLVRPLTEGRALSLSKTCDGSANARFVGDADRARQIVVNLLSNAVKFTPDGGRIRVHCGQTDEGDPRIIAGTGPWTCVRVEDTGIGIDPAAAEQLFEPFIQADTGYTRSQEGSGLGLAISRRLARLMGGDLTVDSRPGEGSAFTLWLPTPPETGEPVETEAADDELLGQRERVHGVSPIGTRLLRDASAIAGSFVRRLRQKRVVPHIAELSDSVVQDHVASLVADLAQTLVLLEDSGDDGAEMLRDGSAIQRTIADRHGLQRQRIGWTDEALEAEFDILGEEIGRVARLAAQEDPAADADRALDLVAGFLDQVRRGSVRTYRMAMRAAAR